MRGTSLRLVLSLLFLFAAAHPAGAEVTQDMEEGGDADPRADMSSIVVLYEKGHLASTVEIPGADPPGEGTWLNDSYIQWNLQTETGDLFQVVLYYDNTAQRYAWYVSHNGQRIECSSAANRKEADFTFAVKSECFGRPKKVATQAIAHMDDAQLDDAADPNDAAPNEPTRPIEED